MIKICIEGWRGINHSYAMVNQRQLIELYKFPVHLKHKDISFYNNKWNDKKNFNGFSKEDNQIIENIESPEINEIFDITYRIAFPYNFEDSKSKKLFIFGTAEYQNIEGHFINGNPKSANEKENLKIITTSNWSRIGFINAGFNEDKVFVVPCGVDCNIFYSIDENKKNEIRKKLNINKDDFIITNIGAMTGNKGVDYLLAAFSVIKEKKNNIKLILKDQSNLYGITPQSYLAELKKTKYGKLINDDLIKNIFFISRNMNLTTLNELYNISDCYISPYRAEGFNITPLEAAASGTPIIVTRGGSTDDYFNAKLGLQIESQLIKENNLASLKPNIESLVECILKVINNPKVYGGKEGSNYVKNNFTWYKVVKKLYNVLTKDNV